MALTRQAKTLTDTQVRTLLRHVENETRHGVRNRVIVMLSFLCGLRALEIVSVKWRMVTGADGKVDGGLSLPNSASKGKHGGRAVPLPVPVQRALRALHEQEQRAGRGKAEDYIVTFQQHATAPAARSNSVRWLFKFWFSQLGFKGATSHSGRRSFATKAAREIGRFGGSLRDVQQLLGHASLSTTQKYLDADPRAQAKLVNNLWKSVE
jgi:integrase/recombinase XerD